MVYAVILLPKETCEIDGVEPQWPKFFCHQSNAANLMFLFQ